MLWQIQFLGKMVKFSKNIPKKNLGSTPPLLAKITVQLFQFYHKNFNRKLVGHYNVNFRVISIFGKNIKCLLNTPKKFWQYSILNWIFKLCRSMWDVSWWTDKNTSDLKEILQINTYFRWFLVNFDMLTCGCPVEIMTISFFCRIGNIVIIFYVGRHSVLMSKYL